MRRIFISTLFVFLLPFQSIAHGGGFMERCDRVSLPSCTNVWNGITETDSALYLVGNNGYCFIYYHTGDVLSVNTGASDTLTGIQFINNTIGYAWGKNGTLIKTSDAGISWSTLTTNTSVDIAKTFFADENNGFFMIGNVIKKTTDGGISWNSLVLPAGITFNDFHFFDGQNGQICGQQTTPSIAGFLYSTTDGGSLWTQIYTDTCAFTKLFYTNDFTGYLYGSTTNQPLLLESTDTGVNWTIKYTRNTWTIGSDVVSYNDKPVFATKVNVDSTYLFNIPYFLDAAYGVIAAPTFIRNIYSSKLNNIESLYIITSSGLYRYTTGNTVCKQITFAIAGMPSDSTNIYNAMKAEKKLRFKALIVNNTLDTITHVEGKLKCSSPFITITDSIAVYEEILNNTGITNNAWSTDWYEIEIDSTTPDDYVFHFEFIYENRIPASVNTDRSIIDVPYISSPFSVTSSIVNDVATPDYPASDNDGIVEPTETAEITPNVKNIGKHYLYSIDAQLTSPFPQLVIWDNHAQPNGTGSVFNHYKIGTDNRGELNANEIKPTYQHYVITDSFLYDYKLPFTLIFKGSIYLFKDANQCAYDYSYIYYAWDAGFYVNDGFALPPDSLLPDYVPIDTTPVTAIPNLFYNNNCKIYPNPNDGDFIIQNSFSLLDNEIEIYNMFGEMVRFEILRQGNLIHINMANNASGVYILMIHTPDVTKTFKVLKN